MGEFVVRRFVAVFLPPAKYRNVKRITEVEGIQFRTSERILVELGYLEAMSAKSPASSTNASEPLDRGSSVILTDRPCIEEKATTPPERYTQATLLSAMAHCGRKVEDLQLRAGLPAGIGTSSTRADIIKKLIEKKFLQPVGGGRTRGLTGLQPSHEAMELIDYLRGPLVAPTLTSPELTAEWELELRRIEDGHDPNNFDSNIRRFVESFVKSASIVKDPIAKQVEWAAIKASAVKDPVEAAPKLEDKLIDFGKHKGRVRYGDMEELHPAYCVWVCNLDDKFGSARPFQEYLRSVGACERLACGRYEQGSSASKPPL